MAASRRVVHRGGVEDRGHLVGRRPELAHRQIGALGHLGSDDLRPPAHELLGQAVVIDARHRPRRRVDRLHDGIADALVVAVSVAGIERHHDRGLDLVDEVAEPLGHLAERGCHQGPGTGRSLHARVVPVEQHDAIDAQERRRPTQLGGSHHGQVAPGDPALRRGFTRLPSRRADHGALDATVGGMSKQ